MIKYVAFFGPTVNEAWSVLAKSVANYGGHWVRKDEDPGRATLRAGGRQGSFFHLVLLIVNIVQLIFSNTIPPIFNSPVTKGSAFICKNIILSHYFQHLSHFHSGIFIHINYPSVARTRGSCITVTNTYRRQGHDDLHTGWFMAIIFLCLWNLSSLNYGYLAPQWSTSTPLE